MANENGVVLKKGIPNDHFTPVRDEMFDSMYNKSGVYTIGGVWVVPVTAA